MRLSTSLAVSFGIALLGVTRVFALTGCNCYGLLVSNSGVVLGYPANTQFQLLYRDTSVDSNPNTARLNGGYCIVNDQLTAGTAANIADGINRNVDTIYTNITGTRQWCTQYNKYNTSQCVAYVQEQKRQSIIQNANTLSQCQYPTNANYIPTDCRCGFTCTNGFTACGRECINPATQTCSSGIPRPRTKKRDFKKCPSGLRACPIGKVGWECIDTSNDLESCGGCTGVESEMDGEDCTEMPGAFDVACVKGKCQATKCGKGYKKVGNKCVKHATRFDRAG